MAEMFDGVSGRYDLLNRIMTAGRDASWREAMWREVPDEARVVLDLCTGSGVSLTGLRQPGRLVLGIDASLRMLQQAREAHGRSGWAPRLACADAFRLPLRDATIDCVTVAFGVRNLRPALQALFEIRRVLRPGGTLVVLEATAPAAGPLAPLHRFYIRRVIPLAGRLSSDPPAYEYLSRSILEFGAGPEFDRALVEAGFRVGVRRSFLFGATGLWVADRALATAEGNPAQPVQAARLGQPTRGGMPTHAARRAGEWRWWNAVQLAISLIILVGLAYALWTFAKWSGDMPLDSWQRKGMVLMLVAGIVAFAVRSVVLALRIGGPPPRF
jgi:demethylmenaquinone methyltransferase/2-methoxy-6-polyprenyl-1,4-benzoquinol methylase